MQYKEKIYPEFVDKIFQIWDDYSIGHKSYNEMIERVKAKYKNRILILRIKKYK